MIVFNNVSYRYNQGNKHSSVSNINLRIQKGEVVVFTGASGCGKTTVTRLINGLIPNFYEGELSGSVYVAGKEIASLPLHHTARIVGSVFQNPKAQFFNVDTNAELAFGCENFGMRTEQIQERLEKTTLQFEMSHLLNKNIFQLSGGEKQKIACASVHMAEPMIFVLDEPSSNLDMQAMANLRNIIAHWKSAGKTVVIAEHRLHYLEGLIDQLIYMEKGAVQRVYSRNELLSIRRSELVQLGLRAIEIGSLPYEGVSLSPTVDTMTFKAFQHGYRRNQIALSIEKLTVPKGAVIGIIGQNGAGKTTFARYLCGLTKRCKGLLEDETGQYKGHERLKHCFMVMQDVNHQLFTESVLDEVMLGMDRPDQIKAMALLKPLGLEAYADRHPMSLSGGQKQRVAIASAVASDRACIIFDEPTSGLDYKHMNEVAKLLQNLARKGKTVMLITHDVELMYKCVNYVVHLEKGVVLEHYPFNRETQHKLAEFIEIESANKGVV